METLKEVIIFNPGVVNPETGENNFFLAEVSIQGGSRDKFMFY